MIPLIGFTPVAPPATPGCIVACEQFIPYESGMQGAPGPIASAAAALASSARGAVVVSLLDGTRRIFAGTQTKLYELASTTWTDVSRAGSYTGSTESRWSFTQFGDATIAANGEEIQRSLTSGAFSDIAGAPEARMVLSCKGFVLAFDTTDGTYGISHDRWWCSALYDETDWAPDISTQSTTGRLVDVEGAFSASALLGDTPVAFKQEGMWVGNYVGAPIVWDWTLIPGEVGCVGQEAVCDVGGALFFVGQSNIWLFDGSRPIPVDTGKVRRWFYARLNATYRYRTICTFDRATRRVWIRFPASSEAIDECLVYHLDTKQWGTANVAVEAALNYSEPGITWDTLPYSTWDSMPDVPWDSEFWLSGGQALAYFDASHKLQTLTGVSVASSFMTGDMGDEDSYSSLDNIKLRFAVKPESASATGYYYDAEGDDLNTGDTSLLEDNKFDLRQDARFHRVQFAFTGNVQVSAMRPKMIGGGIR